MGVTIVAATKYVSVEDMSVLIDVGVEVVGENRAQDLEQKHAAYGDAFRWHFIGHLQSNKVKVVNRMCELVHSLDSESAARRLAVPALVEVNLADEVDEVGDRARRTAALPRALPRHPWAHDDAAGDAGSRDVTAVLPAASGARVGARARRAVDGDEPGLPHRRGGGRHPRASSGRPLPHAAEAPAERRDGARADRPARFPGRACLPLRARERASARKAARSRPRRSSPRRSARTRRSPYARAVAIILEATDQPDEVGWRISNEGIAKMFGTEDFTEGLAAFVEKRAPKWKGR